MLSGSYGQMVAVGQPIAPVGGAAPPAPPPAYLIYAQAAAPAVIDAKVSCRISCGSAVGLGWFLVWLQFHHLLLVAVCLSSSRRSGRTCMTGTSFQRLRISTSPPINICAVGVHPGTRVRTMHHLRCDCTSAGDRHLVNVCRLTRRLGASVQQNPVSLVSTMPGGASTCARTCACACARVVVVWVLYSCL